MEKIINGVCFAFVTLSALAWLDTLWIFGVENSQRFTWWGFIHWLAN